MATFTKQYSEYLGGTNGKSMVLIHGTLSLTTEGGTDGDIPISLFGDYSKFRMVCSAITSGNTALQVFAISSNEASLMTCNLDESVDNNRTDVADVTGSFGVTVIVQ